MIVCKKCKFPVINGQCACSLRGSFHIAEKPEPEHVVPVTKQVDDDAKPVEIHSKGGGFIQAASIALR